VVPEEEDARLLELLRAQVRHILHNKECLDQGRRSGMYMLSARGTAQGRACSRNKKCIHELCCLLYRCCGKVFLVLQSSECLSITAVLQLDGVCK
jgi:hypothetical protein